MNTESQPAENVAQANLKSNGLGLAALIIGIIAAVFSFVPLIQYGMGFVAFVGIVLGLVGLFLKGRKKVIAIVGTIVSIIALILSFVMSAAYTQSFVEGVSQAIDDSTPRAEVVTGDSDGDDSSDRGTRENPLPIGTTITIGPAAAPEWEVTVGPVILDATAEVLAANQFNDEPEEGFQYALINLDVTYIGESTGTPWLDLSVSYVGADSVTYLSSDTYAVAPDSLNDINELFPGGSASGKKAIAIPTAGAADGTWRVGASFGGKDLFFAAE